MNQVDFKVKWTHPKMISKQRARKYKKNPHDTIEKVVISKTHIHDYIPMFEILPINP